MTQFMHRLGAEPGWPLLAATLLAILGAALTYTAWSRER